MYPDDEALKRKALHALKSFYGYNSFRPLQWQVISHVMHGGDAVVLMPTGGGKSMCYQMPALLSEGCAIVVSPLLALMKDQVDALIALGIPAATVNSMQTETANRDIINNVYGGRIKLLYISPEKLLAEVDNWSVNMPVSLIAIDEAHCISQWGHDFRPEYTQLGTLRDRFKDVPIIALTATADRLTRDDIAQQLHIPDARLFLSSFDRPNISLNVVSGMAGKQKMQHIVRFIDRHQGESGIVYCLSRVNTERMTEKLRAAGINAHAFHAGMSTAERAEVQRQFACDEINVICATVAFGMGIDKSNVRWVIHNNMPRNIESYYQEIGRAGRDGMPAEALMFYSFADVMALTKFAQESGQASVNLEKLRRMQQYAESSVCRRRILLNYFNERYDHDCHNCDVCNDPPERIDGTTYAQMALSAIARTGEQAGVTTIIEILRGSRRAEIIARNYDQLRTFGVGRNLSFGEWNAYMLQMLQLGLFEVAYNESNYLKITEYGHEVLRGRQVELVKYVPHVAGKGKAKAEVKAKAATVFADSELQDPNDEGLYNHLKDVRMALARAQGVPPYIIFNDKTLRIMAHERPVTRAVFSTLYGVGEAKTEKYWRQFTSAIAQYLAKHK